MNVKTGSSKYKDINAVTLENENIKVQFLPEHGGKMASLVDKNSSVEFLVQGANRKYKALEYDGNFVEAECTGFDDMFPTIDRVYYESYPWKGVEIPDHGEVCGLKWDYQINSDNLYMCVHGIRFPYRFEKTARLKSGNILNIEYKVTNESNYDMDFIWVAHAMINAEEGGEIFIPYSDGSDATCIFSQDKNFGSYGDRVKWPNVKYKDGQVKNIRVTSYKNENGNTFKIYFNEKTAEGWCAYRYKSIEKVLVLTYPKDKIPYLGIWVNEGSFHDLYNIAMEPCTGTFDRIDLAKMHKQNSVLKARSEYSWFLNFQLEQYGEFRQHFTLGNTGK